MDEYTNSEEQTVTLPEPNPETRAAHRRDYFRRVMLPFLTVLFILFGMVVAFALLEVGDVATWSQIATITLISIALLGGLLYLGMVIFLNYLVSRLLHILPPYTRMAQEGIEQIMTNIEKGADIPPRPIIQVSSFIAAINALFHRKP